MKSRISLQSKVVWKRPESFPKACIPRLQEGGKFKVIEGLVEPADIKQGSLGDCWFLCALASVAEFPALVMELFLDDPNAESKCGVYKMQICLGGVWRHVVVDDFFPCERFGGPLYSHANGPELWVLLLEKVYAKIHGSYAAIESGNMRIVLSNSITHCCTCYYQPNYSSIISFTVSNIVNPIACSLSQANRTKPSLI